MHAILTAIVLTLLILLPGGSAEAAIYSYQDEQGRTIFVDEEYKIPAKHRGNTAVIQERRSLPVPAVETDSEGTPAEPGAERGNSGEPAEPPARTVVDRETQQRARQQVEKLDRERTYQTPVMVRGNRVLVPAEVGIGDRTAHLMLLLDTGATSTVLHRPSVKDLAFAPGEQINTQLASGRKVSLERVNTRFIDIGPFELKDFPVMLVTPQGPNFPHDGMLGMDFLETHPYEIDYTNEIIRWKITP